MASAIDLNRYPIHQPDSVVYAALVRRCQHDLARSGMFNLNGFLKPSACHKLAKHIEPLISRDGFVHSRRHNVYFQSSVDSLPDNHPALKEFETINTTLCGDQLAFSPLIEVYEYPPLIKFLSSVMGKTALYPMADPLARVNVMQYRQGEALNWHFDRAEFTTTLLLQSPVAGGVFEFRPALRSEEDPNYKGVGRLLEGGDHSVQQLALEAGTLNIFKGKNTAHRVTPVRGDIPRMIAVFSYYEQPGVNFGREERLGFYGRVG